MLEFHHWAATGNALSCASKAQGGVLRAIAIPEYPPKFDPATGKLNRFSFRIYVHYLQPLTGIIFHRISCSSITLVRFTDHKLSTIENASRGRRAHKSLGVRAVALLVFLAGSAMAGIVAADLFSADDLLHRLGFTRTGHARLFEFALLAALKGFFNVIH